MIKPIEKALPTLEKINNILFASYRKKKLSNTDFSILSNNCWGGHVYQRFGLPYTSPTVGLYFFAEEYLNLLKDLKTNLYLPLSFIKSSESKYFEELRKRKQLHIPIGLLGDKIEIVFLHYLSEKEAYEKWQRRLSRFNINNLIVKFSQMNLCEDKHICLFNGLPYTKKLLFLAKEYPHINGVVVDKYSNGNEITNDTLYFNAYVDLVQLINQDY